MPGRADKRTTRKSSALKKIDNKYKKLKKTAKRRNVKNASLNVKYHNLAVHEYLDFDYVSKLSEKDKEFLNKFAEEHYRAYFDKDSKKHLHKKKDRKEVYNANNARNRCILSRSKRERNLAFVDTNKAKNLTSLDKTSYRDVEDAMVEFVDYSLGLEDSDDS